MASPSARAPRIRNHAPADITRQLALAGQAVKEAHAIYRRGDARQAAGMLQLLQFRMGALNAITTDSTVSHNSAGWLRAAGAQVAVGDAIAKMQEVSGIEARRPEHYKKPGAKRKGALRLANPGGAYRWFTPEQVARAERLKIRNGTRYSPFGLKAEDERYRAGYFDGSKGEPPAPNRADAYALGYIAGRLDVGRDPLRLVPKSNPNIRVSRRAYARSGYTRSDGTKVHATRVPATTFLEASHVPHPRQSRGAKAGPHRGEAKWIRHEGKLGGPGYTTRGVTTRHKLLSAAVAKYGYRSTLGSLLVLLRSHAVGSNAHRVVQGDETWLKAKFGGKGSFGKRPVRAKGKTNPRLVAIKATIPERVALAKREILDDVKHGHVPAHVRSFSELHDYVDANGYGGWFRDDPKWAFRGPWNVDAANAMQNQIDAWIKSGALKHVKVTR